MLVQSGEEDVGGEGEGEEGEGEGDTFSAGPKLTPDIIQLLLYHKISFSDLTILLA